MKQQLSTKQYLEEEIKKTQKELSQAKQKLKNKTLPDWDVSRFSKSTQKTIAEYEAKEDYRNKMEEYHCMLKQMPNYLVIERAQDIIMDIYIAHGKRRSFLLEDNHNEFGEMVRGLEEADRHLEKVRIIEKTIHMKWS